MEVNLVHAKDTLVGLANGLIAHLPNFVAGFMVLILSVIIASSVRKIPVRVCELRRYPESVGIIMGRLSQWCIWLGGLLIALSIIVPSFNARDLIQLLGVSGVAIGFAFKEVFQNFLAGVIILISAPFRIGDKIKFAEFEGIVEDIETRATRIRLPDGRVAIVPNSKLFTDPVVVDKKARSNKSG